MDCCEALRGFTVLRPIFWQKTTKNLIRKMTEKHIMTTISGFSFDWLTPLEKSQNIRGMDHYHTRDDLHQVIGLSQRLHVAFPDPFLRFMALPNVLERTLHP